MVSYRVQNVRTFANAEGRQYINLITVERFPKRKADEETGEYVETTTNELVMSLRQFMHVVYLTPNFLQVYFKDFDRKEYTVTPDGVCLNPYCSGQWSRTMLIMHEQGENSKS